MATRKAAFGRGNPDIPQVIGQLLSDAGIEAFPDFFAKLLPRIARQERVERCGKIIDTLAAQARHIKKGIGAGRYAKCTRLGVSDNRNAGLNSTDYSLDSAYQSAMMPLREKLLC